MATDKTFNVFGVSKLDGEYKVRFANDILRSKVLHKHGHLDVRLEDVGVSVSKYEGIKMIQSMDQFSDAAAQAAIAEYLDEKAPKAKVSKPVAKATKTPVAKTTTVKDTKKSREAQALAEARAKAAELASEDAPF